MGWKGDPCYYCRADLHVVLDQQDWLEDRGRLAEYPDDDPRSFDWHMAGRCMDEGWVEVMLDSGAELHIKAPSIEWA